MQSSCSWTNTIRAQQQSHHLWQSLVRVSLTCTKSSRRAINICWVKKNLQPICVQCSAESTSTCQKVSRSIILIRKVWWGVANVRRVEQEVHQYVRSEVGVSSNCAEFSSSNVNICRVWEKVMNICKIQYEYYRHLQRWSFAEFSRLRTHAEGNFIPTE